MKKRKSKTTEEKHFFFYCFFEWCRTALIWLSLWISGEYHLYRANHYDHKLKELREMVKAKQVRWWYLSTIVTWVRLFKAKGCALTNYATRHSCRKSGRYKALKWRDIHP